MAMSDPIRTAWSRLATWGLIAAGSGASAIGLAVVAWQEWGGYDTDGPAPLGVPEPVDYGRSCVAQLLAALAAVVCTCAVLACRRRWRQVVTNGPYSRHGFEVIR